MDAGIAGVWEHVQRSSEEWGGLPYLHKGGIHLTQAALYLVISIDKLPVRYGGGSNGLPYKTVEEHSAQSRRAAVESEGVFVKIVVQMLAARRRRSSETG